VTTPPFNAGRRHLAVALGCGAIGLGRHALALPRASSTYWERAPVREFAQATSERFGLPPGWVESAIRSGRPSEAAARWMSAASAAAAQDWHRYRRSQIDAHRLARGLSFWWKYQAALERAMQDFGTAPEIVVAIIGVESQYGRVTGRFRILDVLLTLAFDVPRRAGEYQEELAQFLMLSREQNVEASSYLGSIAGAIGLPQFLPSSIRRYAIDFDADGRIDLAHSPHDAIGSVGHFLQQHGWRAELPVMLAAPRPADPALALEDGPTRWSSLAAIGLDSDLELPPDETVRVFGLNYLDEQGRAQRDPRIGTANFEALLGYNRSNLYAATVAELAVEMRRRFDADATQSASASG
jgi:membrane-bound lytic murein transglycosylase B